MGTWRRWGRWPILFTSVGDTADADWSGLVFVGGTGHLRYATVRYGADRNTVLDAAVEAFPATSSAYYRSDIAIRDVQAGSVLLDHVTIGNNGDDYYYQLGIYVENSVVAMLNSVFTGIGVGVGSDPTNDGYIDAPLFIHGGASRVTLTDNTFVGDHPNLVVLSSFGTTSAMMGQDTTLTKQKGLDGYLLGHREVADFTIPAGVTLTLGPGVWARGRHDAQVTVLGRLEAAGTADAPVVFTSVTDTAASSWSGLVFDTGTGRLDHAQVRYGGDRNTVLDAAGKPYHRSDISARNVPQPGLVLDDVEIGTTGSTHYYQVGLYAQDSHVTLKRVKASGVGDGLPGDEDCALWAAGATTMLVSDSHIDNNGGTGLLVSGSSAYVHVTGSTITHNGLTELHDGVRHEGASTVMLGGEEGSGNSIHGNGGYGVR